MSLPASLLNAGRSGRIPQVALLGALCVAGSSVAAVEPASSRVLILTAAPEGTNDLGPQVVAQVSGAPSLSVVPAAEVARVLTARATTAAKCMVMRSCFLALADKLGADLILKARLEHGHDGFVLTIERVISSNVREARQASRTLRDLSGLSAAVASGVKQVLDLPGASPSPAAPPPIGGPVVTEAPPKPADASLILVLASGGPGEEAGAVETLRGIVTRQLAADPTRTLVPEGAVRRALKDLPAACARDRSCSVGLAARVGARTLIRASLTRDETRLVVTVERINAQSAAEARVTSESMKRFSSLELNVRLCLRRLFEEARPAPQPTPAVGPVPAPAPVETQQEAPPIALAADAPPARLEAPPPRPEELPPAVLETPRPRSFSTARTVGIIAAAVGGAGLIVATVLGVTAQQSQALGEARATAPIAAQVRSVNARALGADCLFGLGGALGAAGVGVALVF